MKFAKFMGVFYRWKLSFEATSSPKVQIYAEAKPHVYPTNKENVCLLTFRHALDPKTCS